MAVHIHEDHNHDENCRKKPKLEIMAEDISSASLDLLFEDLENNNHNENNHNHNHKNINNDKDKDKNKTKNNNNNNDNESNSIMQNDLKVDEAFLDDEITKALKSIDEYDSKINSTTTSSSPEEMLFDSPNTISSTSDDGGIKQPEKVYAVPPVSVPNMDTIASIKKSMIETSKFISTFTTLKTTYLKLCKEFNYLLTKFNDNEKIKIDLIHENNELKKLLTQIITERELERKRNLKETKEQRIQV